MTNDDLMLFIQSNPNCTSLDISEEFGITIAKAFTRVNRLIERRHVYKTTVRSPTNGKKILGYKADPNFDHMVDNEDGSMSKGDVMRYLARIKDVYGVDGVVNSVSSLNRWRRTNGIKEIRLEEVL